MTLDEEVTEKTSLLKSDSKSNVLPGGSTGNSNPGADGGGSPSSRVVSFQGGITPGFTPGETGWREEVPQLINPNEVLCRVCGSTIQIEHIKLQYVAKCSNCKEATPIFSAPPGKKYVRCCCCCLLICRSASERVYCPRSNCNRIIYFSPQDPQFNPQTSDGTFQNFICPHCNSNFYFNVLSNSAARCPHCHKHSSVDTQFKNVRGIGFGILALLLTIISIIILATTYSSHQAYIYTICVGFFIMSLLSGHRSIYYFRLRVSARVNE